MVIKVVKVSIMRHCVKKYILKWFNLSSFTYVNIHCKIRAKTCKPANCGPQNTVQVTFFSGILSATKLTTENIILRSFTPITLHCVDLFGFCIKKKGKEQSFGAKIIRKRLSGSQSLLMICMNINLTLPTSKKR